MTPQSNSASQSRSFLAVSFALFVFFAGVAAMFFAGAARSATHTAAKAVQSGLAPDKGKFRILVGGAQVGTEDYEITPNGGGWLAKGTSEIHAANSPVQRVSGTLQLHADGAPAHYEWSAEGAKKTSSAIGFANNTATIELRMEGMRPYTQTFTFNSPMVVVLDNNLYHQYVILSRLYDWNKGGAQTFSVLVPQEMTPGTVTVDLLGPQDTPGTRQDELRVKTEDNELDLFLEAGRLVRIVAPSANAEILRE